MHDSAVIALAISRDSEMVASGSQDGKVKVPASLLQTQNPICQDIAELPSSLTQGGDAAILP